MIGLSLLSSPALSAVILLVFTFLLVKIIQGTVRYRRYFKFFNSLPGETDFHWIWGNLHKYGSDSEKRMKYTNGLMLKHPKFTRVWFSPLRPVIMLHHPDTVKILLKTSEPKPRGPSGVYSFLLQWLGEGLLLAGGPRWARSRRLLTPAFHFDILRPYVNVYNEAADILLSKIDRYAESGESFELFSLISLCTLDIILKCAMSFDDDVQRKGESHPYLKAVVELAELWSARGRNPFVYLDSIYFRTPNGRRFLDHCKFVHSVSEDIIAKRRQALEKSGHPKSRYLDFLDILLTAKDSSGVGLTSLEIRNEVDTFLFGGHDTTSSGISWIMYSLACNNDIQKQVQAEVDEILGGRDNDNLEWDDIPKFEYLSRVVKEGMRLHCPIPFMQRQLTSPMVIEGQTLPIGTHCTVDILNLHHNPEVWEDPWEFRPNRFLPENVKKRDNYAFVPFSAGPRNCIGQHFALNEEKVLLARIFRKYQLELDPNHVVKKKTAAVMRTETGIRVIAKRRF